MTDRRLVTILVLILSSIFMMQKTEAQDHVAFQGTSNDTVVVADGGRINYYATNGSTGFKSVANSIGFSVEGAELGYEAEAGIGFYARECPNWGFRSRFSGTGFQALSNTSNGFVAESNDFNGYYATNNDCRAGFFIGTAPDYPAVEIKHSDDSKTDLHFDGVARITSDSSWGISLNSTNKPIITRSFDPFDSGEYEGLGRWGLFMEPSTLVIGIPSIANRRIELAKYNVDGSRVMLVDVDQSGNLTAIGNVCAANMSCNSDARYKRQIHTLEGAVDNVMRMRGVSYYWDQSKWPDRFSSEKQLGVIAQEVEQIYPELVHTDEDGYKSVSYDKLTPILLQAIKEQQAQIEELKQGKSNLEDEMKGMKSELEKIMAALKL